jgi:hypothetical protein
MRGAKKLNIIKMKMRSPMSGMFVPFLRSAFNHPDGALAWTTPTHPQENVLWNHHRIHHLILGIIRNFQWFRQC